MNENDEIQIHISFCPQRNIHLLKTGCSNAYNKSQKVLWLGFAWDSTGSNFYLFQNVCY